MLRFVGPLTIGFLTAIMLLHSAAPARAGAPCTCRYFGQRLELGAQVCLRTPQGLRVARCGLELNNTAWKITKTPCTPLAMAQPGPKRRGLPGDRR
jgi:hypothetical protein